MSRPHFRPTKTLAVPFSLFCILFIKKIRRCIAEQPLQVEAFIKTPLLLNPHLRNYNRALYLNFKLWEENNAKNHSRCISISNYRKKTTRKTIVSCISILKSGKYILSGLTPQIRKQVSERQSILTIRLYKQPRYPYFKNYLIPDTS
jgi:hypothetical protein